MNIAHVKRLNDAKSLAQYEIANHPDLTDGWWIRIEFQDPHEIVWIQANDGFGRSTWTRDDNVLFHVLEEMHKNYNETSDKKEHE